VSVTEKTKGKKQKKKEKNIFLSREDGQKNLTGHGPVFAGGAAA